jgi:hypothetical protein
MDHLTANFSLSAHAGMITRQRQPSALWVLLFCLTMMLLPNRAHAFPHFYHRLRPLHSHMTVTKKNHPNDEKTVDFDSLDVVLERARKRKPTLATTMLTQMTQPIRINDQTFIKWLSGVDVLYISLALVILHANGFALGYGVGKWMTSTRFLRELLLVAFWKPQQQRLILQWWPLALAIVLDQII